MSSFNKFLLGEILKVGINQTIRQAYAVFRIGQTDHNRERLYELKEELSEVSNKLQMISASLERIENKIDENRVAGLLRGLHLLRDASRMTSGKITVLEQSLVAFHDIIYLPPAGKTGQWKNAELRAIASFGVAAVHHALGNSDELIAEHLVEGFLSNPDIAKAFIEPSLFEKFYVLELQMRPKASFSFVSSDIGVGNYCVDIYDDNECVGQAYYKSKHLEVVTSPGSHSYKAIFLKDHHVREKVSETVFINIERGKEYRFSIKYRILKDVIAGLIPILEDTKRKLNLRTQGTAFDAFQIGNILSLEHASTKDISPEDYG